MNFPTKKALREVAKLCLLMDVMRDEMKVNALLATKQNAPTREALLKLKKILIKRRKSYK